MSFKLVAQVIDLLLSRVQKDVLRVLCDSSDDVPNQNGVGINCYPSIPIIAWKSDYSVRHTQRAMHDLEAPPHIIVPVRVHLLYATTEYEIHLERATKKPPYEPQLNRQGGGRKKSDKGAKLAVPPSHPARRQNVMARGAKNSETGCQNTQNRGDMVSYNPKDVPCPLPGEPNTPLPPSQKTTRGEKQKRLTRMERRMRVEQPTGQEFSTALCEFCDPPHEWPSEPYFDRAMRHRACPALSNQFSKQPQNQEVSQ